MHPLPEIRHQVAKGSHLPALVQSIEALRDTIVGGRDLVGVDGIQLLSRDFWIPEDQRPPFHQVRIPGRRRRLLCGTRRPGGAALAARRLDRVYKALDDLNSLTAGTPSPTLPTRGREISRPPPRSSPQGGGSIECSKHGVGGRRRRQGAAEVAG